MTRSVLLALEEDRFGDLAAPVYVRGFLRIYAQFLEIQPDAVVEAYEVQVAALDAPASPPAAQLPEYLRDQTRSPGGLTSAQSFLLVALAAIALVVLWSVNRTKKPLQMAARPGISAPATATGPAAGASGHSGVPNGRRPVPGKDVLVEKPGAQPH